MFDVYGSVDTSLNYQHELGVTPLPLANKLGKWQVHNHNYETKDEQGENQGCGNADKSLTKIQDAE